MQTKLVKYKQDEQKEQDKVLKRGTKNYCKQGRINYKL